MQVQKIQILKFITELMWQFHSWITWNKYRFHRDSMVGSHLFYLVPTLIINHSDLQDLAKCLLFWKRDLPSASSLLSELKQWQRFWKLKSESLDNIIPADLAHCIHAADEDVFPNIRVLLIIACTIYLCLAVKQKGLFQH